MSELADMCTQITVLRLYIFAFEHTVRLLFTSIHGNAQQAGMQNTTCTSKLYISADSCCLQTSPTRQTQSLGVGRLLGVSLHLPATIKCRSDPAQHRSNHARHAGKDTSFHANIYLQSSICSCVKAKQKGSSCCCTYAEQTYQHACRTDFPTNRARERAYRPLPSASIELSPKSLPAYRTEQ